MLHQPLPSLALPLDLLSHCFCHSLSPLSNSLLFPGLLQAFLSICLKHNDHPDGLKKSPEKTDMPDKLIEEQESGVCGFSVPKTLAPTLRAAAEVVMGLKSSGPITNIVHKTGDVKVLSCYS